MIDTSGNNTKTRNLLPGSSALSPPPPPPPPDMMAPAPTDNDVSTAAGSRAEVGGGEVFPAARRRVLSAVKGVSGDGRKVIHCMKVGLALVVVSLLYMVGPMFEEVGQNGMWAVMTVVVMFEFYAGATLGKGINRIIGTLSGGILGCLVAIVGDEIGGIGKDIVIGSAVFLSGGAATYCRLVPKLKRRYDYGFIIFIMSFSLVAISGIRMEKVVEVGRDRIATIGMGFAACIFVSLVICPIWAGDELHNSTASKFNKLATGIEDREKGGQEGVGNGYFQACKSILNSKSNDELLANHAKWEPWHGKFGLTHPWDKYLEVGEHLREIAATIFSLKLCLQSPKQPPPMQRQILREPCETLMLTTLWILRELGDSFEKMEVCKAKSLINPKFQSAELLLSPPLASSPLPPFGESHENQVAVTSFVFLLVEIVEKVEALAQKVEEFGEAANFKVKKVGV